MKSGSEIRKPEYEINKLFLDRWSSRAFTGEKIQEKELMSFFEAAKWAPSSYNNQPWRFLYSLKEDENWDKFFSLLIDFNKSWCKNASALMIILSKKIFEHNNQPSKTHSFDTGAAWMSLALQAHMKGFVAHGMEGFDYEKAREILKISDEYEIEAMAAIGKPGNEDLLPKELREKEIPSNRKKVSEIAFKEFKNLK